MNLFVIEFPSICMRAVGLQDSIACGMELTSLYRRQRPTQRLSHYHGNFFWANCDYVASRRASELDRFDFYSTEDFLLGYGAEQEAELCAYNAAGCTSGSFLYAFECSRHDYFDRLRELMKSFDLPVSYYDPLAFSLLEQEFRNKSKKAEVCSELQMRLRKKHKVF